MPGGGRSAANSSIDWIFFVNKANRFVQKTQEHVLQGINPGGIYQAIWCRDAAYILRDWFLSGNIAGTVQQIYQIWSHQIEPDREKLVYGRGSPEMKFLSEVAKEDKQKKFEGALPTTIYQTGFSEVYGLNPDIDSTALMISTSSWVLARCLKDRQSLSESSLTAKEDDDAIIASEHSSDYVSSLLSKLGMTDPSKVAEFVIPRMLKAVEYLSSRDTDNDGLLEQNHNEDWMDTVLRAGKIVYSQACWILALTNLATMLSKLGRNNESDKIVSMAYKAIKAVDQKLWSEEDGCYLDIQETHHIGGPYRTLTQDVSLYLVAITENTTHCNLKSRTATIKKHNKEAKKIFLDKSLYNRSLRTLNAIKSRVWKEKWPLVTEVELKATGPWLLKPYHYHNQTFWPWTTGIEMLARSRFEQYEECDILLSKLASEGHPHMHTFYEWINPITDHPDGSFPFRTGISGVRMAIADILQKIKKESAASKTTKTQKDNRLS
jgi:Glycosyl-hydrolase family 116, catalytic region